MKVSVVMTVLNEELSLSSLLEALLSQSRQPDEIVIVDGGSTDGTLKLLERYAGEGSRIRVHRAPGVNIARGRNIGIAEAKSDIIAVTDGGCIPEGAWLEELLKRFTDPDIAAVAGSFRGEWTTRFEYYAALLAVPRESDAGAEEPSLFFGRSSAFRKNAWEQAGGYPEWLYTGEDTLFALRFKELGCRIASAPLAVVRWRPRPNLRKLAKMYFLYGRGNGRILLGSVSGSLYWIRYHAAWILCIIGGVFFPLLWIPAVLVLMYLYLIAALPVVRGLRGECNSFFCEFYIPLIVLTRNVTTNAGFLLGWWENRFRPEFRDCLERYRGATVS
ncbi:glycosyltransferase [Geobacter sp.]|uniref:glycosyltransferase n=1 Tax=Geobacter sp. TaxID=46610 RepID=UPI0027B9CF18|nr:glycosyltransferase [Geobacter sp.]